MMISNTTVEQIQRMLTERDFSGLRRLIVALEIADIAEAIGELEPDDQVVVFRVLPREQAAECFEYLEAPAQEVLIKGLAREQAAAILNDMSPDDRTALLEELPAAATKQALALLSPDERIIARDLLGYPEDSIGRLMTPDYVTVRSDWTVMASLEHIRRVGKDSETLNVIPVVNERGVLIDDLRVRQILLADPDTRIDELTDGSFVALTANDDQETAVQIFKEYDRVAFPVTDSRGVMLGIVTVDDVLDVAEEEATEDIQKIGGSGALDYPYLQVSFWELVRKRGGWLIFLFLGQLLTLNAMEMFRDRLKFSVMMFVPLIISSGGNSGSQAATLVVRAMALEEVQPSDWFRVFRRELMFGLTLGLLLAAIGYLRAFLDRFLGVSLGEEWGIIGLAVGISLTCVVLWGVLVGSMLPFVMRWIGVDPATSSTPFVATIVDVTGLLIYFLVSTTIIASG